MFSLNKDEIADYAQEWFDVDRKHAELFARDLIKNNATKTWLTEWGPQIVIFLFLIIYLIFHR